MSFYRPRCLTLSTQRSGMREFVARAHLHSAALGQTAALDVAAELARELRNPILMRAVEAARSLRVA
jgi:hypothetical protein